MKIVDGSVYSKYELVEIINYILNAEYEFTRRHYIVDYNHQKTLNLLKEVDTILAEMKRLPQTRAGLLEWARLQKQINAIYKKVDRIEKSIEID